MLTPSKHEDGKVWTLVILPDNHLYISINFMPASNYYVAALKLDRRDEEGGEAKEEERREEEGRKAKEEEREVNEERGVAKEASRRESIGSLSGSRVSLQSQQSLTRMSEEYLNKGPLEVLLVVV